MKHWNWSSIYWALWLLIGFCPLEFYGLLSGHPEYTLSDNVWFAEGLSTGKFFANPLDWTPIHWVVFLFMVWLSGHFIAHIWR